MCVTCCLEFKLFAQVIAQRGQLFTALNLFFVTPEASHTMPSVSWLCVQVKPWLESCSQFCCLRSWEAALGIDVHSPRGVLLVKSAISTFSCTNGVVIACDVTFLSAGSSSFFLGFCCVKRDLVFFLRILDLNGGSPPLTYKRFLHILSLLGDPEVPVRNLTAEDFQ